jgi:tetratricopeptide (TPR) repeat protein
MRALERAGWAASDRARYDEAIDLFRQGLNLAQASDDARWHARFLRSIAVALTNTGRYPEALKHLTQSLAIWREIRDGLARGRPSVA